MKNLMILSVVFAILFSAAMTKAQGRPTYADIAARGSRERAANATVDNSRSAVVSEENSEPLDLALAEVRHKLFEKGFKIVSDKSEAQLEVEVKISSDSRFRCYSDRRSYSGRQYCYPDTEFFAYVSLKGQSDSAAYAEGRGKDRRLQRAVEKAADEAANQIPNRKGITVFIKR